MGDATRSNMACTGCGTSALVLRLSAPSCDPPRTRHSPKLWYDDHVCLGCGHYASQPGYGLRAGSLRDYRRAFGRVVRPDAADSDAWADPPAATTDGKRQRARRPAMNPAS